MRQRKIKVAISPGGQRLADWLCAEIWASCAQPPARQPA
jgi:hypothetical protein